MIGRWIEDAFFLLRFAYFYYKAPELERKVGFYPVPAEMPFKQRIKTAYVWATTGKR